MLTHAREIQENYRLTVAPSATVLAVTLDEIKQELDIRGEDGENDRLMRLAKQATDQVERDSRRVIMTQTWQLHLDRFPCHEIEVRRVPIQSITHIKYYTSSVLTPLSSTLYQTDLISEPARIQPVSGSYWPTTDCRVNAVEVEFVAGYASAATVPDYIKYVILATIRGLYHGCEFGDGYWTMIRRLQTFGFTT